MPYIRAHYRRPRRTATPSNSNNGCPPSIMIIAIPFLIAILASCGIISRQTASWIIILLLISALSFLGWKIYQFYQRKRQEKTERIAQQWHLQQVQSQQLAIQHQQMVYREQLRHHEQEKHALELAQRQQEYQLQIQKEKERLTLLKTLGGFFTLTPTEFEEIVGKILSSVYRLQNIHRVGGSGDLGVDLTANDESGNHVIIQCKRYAAGRSIGSPDLQKFIGMMVVRHKAQKGIFVTTSTFTQSAIELARESNITLIDGNSLVQLSQIILPSQ